MELTRVLISIILEKKFVNSSCMLWLPYGHLFFDLWIRDEIFCWDEDMSDMYSIPKKYCILDLKKKFSSSLVHANSKEIICQQNLFK